MKQFTEDTSWESARGDVLHTQSVAHASETHARLARPCDTLLASWNEIEAARRAAGDGITRTNANVAWVDKLLDGWVERFSNRVWADHQAAYHKFFDAPPGEIIRMGLETELNVVKKFHATADETRAPKVVRDMLVELADLETRGKAALEARKKAVEEAARVSLKIQGWKEDANGVRRSIETALDDYANKNSLPRDYASVFFPVVARKKSAKKAKAAGTSAGGDRAGAGSSSASG